MKKNIILIFFLGFIFLNTTVSHAQNPLYDNGISFKALFLDYQSQNGGSISDFKSYHRGFEIGYHRNINENFNVVVPLKIGVVSASHVETNSDNFNCLHKTVYGLDAQLQYHFRKEGTRVTPYAMLGVGGVYEDAGESNVQIPVGLGLFFEVAENAYVNWQSEYRYSLGDNRNNLHHGLGFVYLFSKGDASMAKPKMDKNDSDGDGITDDVDLCPQAAGSPELNGCPDTDGDAIPDYQDDCPNFAGLKAFNGCPDTDSDGIADNKDECPNEAGLAENNGCPANTDIDGDGIPDKDDKCPNIAGIADYDGCPGKKDMDGDGVEDSIDNCPNIKGSASANGCPDRDGDGVIDSQDKCPSNFGLRTLGGCPDSDGDWIDDSRDRCPTTPGLSSNSGCPEIAKEDRSTLDIAMRAVQFDTGNSKIKAESYSILSQIADIMGRYPDYNLSIEGHTDNVGDAKANQILSERRAKATYDYIVSKGISSARLSYVGYGEVQPIADNNTLKGKALNRRVEFVLRPR